MMKLESVPVDILTRIPDVQELLAKENEVIFAYLFGGMVSGRVKPLSDVEIAVYVSDEIDLDVYKLELFLKDYR